MIGRRTLVDDHTHAKGTSSREAASEHQQKVGARYTPAPGAVSTESSGCSQHTDHRYGTL
jgi:hypothetical protein